LNQVNSTAERLRKELTDSRKQAGQLDSELRQTRNVLTTQLSSVSPMTEVKRRHSDHASDPSPKPAAQMVLEEEVYQLRQLYEQSQQKAQRMQLQMVAGEGASTQRQQAPISTLLGKKGSRRAAPRSSSSSSSEEDEGDLDATTDIKPGPHISSLDSVLKHPVHVTKSIPTTASVVQTLPPIAPVSASTQSMSVVDQNEYRRRRPGKGIPDSVIVPKSFHGISNDAEDWLASLLRYVEFKEYSESEKKFLLSCLLKDGAKDWHNALTADQTKSFQTTVEAFEESFFPSKELIWSQAGELWRKGQTSDESVEQYVVRIRLASRRLNMTDESLNYAIIQGLRPHLRMAVLQQGVKDLKETIRLARLAEVAQVSDPLSALVMDSLKNQSSKIEHIMSKVSAIAEAQRTPQAPISSSPQAITSSLTPMQSTQYSPAENAGQPSRPRQQQRKQTPQNYQRNNYARQQQQQCDQPAVFVNQPTPHQQSAGLPTSQYASNQTGYQQQQQTNQQSGWYGNEQTAYQPSMRNEQANGYQQQRLQYQPSAGRGNLSYGQRQQEGRQSYGPARQSDGSTCQNCGLRSHAPQTICPAHTQHCYRCQSQGHFSRMCQQGRGRGQSQVQHQQ
jgi:hypothetical protein